MVFQMKMAEVLKAATQQSGARTKFNWGGTRMKSGKYENGNWKTLLCTSTGAAHT